MLCHILSDWLGASGLTPSRYTETGIWYTAIGSASFLTGVWLVHNQKAILTGVWLAHNQKAVKDLPWEAAGRRDFGLFCSGGRFLCCCLFVRLSRWDYQRRSRREFRRKYLDSGVLLGSCDALRRSSTSGSCTVAGCRWASMPS